MPAPRHGYTRDLGGQTFHVLATRHLPLPKGLSRKDENVLDTLSDRLRQDAALAAEMAVGYRCILVDEFQYANDAIFGILKSLAEASAAGVFATGDDHQDITRWNRAGREFSETYFEQFKRAFETKQEELCTLAVNFRSGHAIVEGSERTLAETLEGNPVSGRHRTGEQRWRAQKSPCTIGQRSCWRDG